MEPATASTTDSADRRRQPPPPATADQTETHQNGTHGNGTHGNGTHALAAPIQARIRPWVDPVVDPIGHDPRGWYFERYWLSVIGPTATMVMRRIADGFDHSPDGFVLDLGHCAATMGLSFRRGAASPFGRALQRCVMFGLAREVADGFVVRRFAPDVAERHLQRLPDDVQAHHADTARIRAGLDCQSLAERLTEVGVPAPIAHRAADAARQAS